ncbi:LOW QUALITY PROTEIN: hypothetical protein BRADI_4g13504v3 [Brachypodium distachyon]|uniref:MATH domain-containing protein n=1 Tax=Brachypodium distachyon TaxID=15368 RepID=A0A2K2CMJ5_BRADI|nr:LOW QUALITY PROTEIN: hypothetical protein BRADI_4g13504v3 [Brachypodium distachyon]
MSSSSASSITGKALTGSHVLKIDGYSRTTGIGTGNCVKSRPFTAGGHKWCLEYYPDGYNSTYGSNWISIPSPSGRGWPIRALYKISLLDQYGQPGSIKAESSKCCTFNTLAIHGSYKFIKNEDLLKSAYLKDDSFSIRCDITVVTEIVAEDVVVATAPAVGLGVKKEARGV